MARIVPVRRRPRGVFRSRNQNRPYWTSEQGVHNPAAGALAFTEIFASNADGEVNVFMEANPTIHRILLSGTITCSAIGSSTVGMALGKVHEAINPTFGTFMDPLNITALAESDWLWTRRVGLALISLVGAAALLHYEADIRVKRRLDSNERLVFVTSNAAGGAAVTHTWAARMLSKLNV